MSGLHDCPRALAHIFAGSVLPVCMPACLHACMHVCLFACLPACTLARMRFALSITLRQIKVGFGDINPLLSPPACLLACMPACLPVCMHACLHACLHAHLPACLPVCLSMGTSCFVASGLGCDKTVASDVRPCITQNLTVACASCIAQYIKTIRTTQHAKNIPHNTRRL